MNRRVRLEAIAHARSGDKGDGSNVGLIADSQEVYELLRGAVTAERVKEHFRGVCRGAVERFEVPNLRAFNFLLHDSLGGGGTESLQTDAQGKTHAQGLLAMEIDVPEELLPPAGGAMDRAPRPGSGGGAGGGSRSGSGGEEGGGGAGGGEEGRGRGGERRGGER